MNEYKTEFTLEVGKCNNPNSDMLYLAGTHKDEALALIQAALAYTEAKGSQRTTAEITLRDTAKALRRAAVTCPPASAS